MSYSYIIQNLKENLHFLVSLTIYNYHLILYIKYQINENDKLQQFIVSGDDNGWLAYMILQITINR